MTSRVRGLLAVAGLLLATLPACDSDNPVINSNPVGVTGEVGDVELLGVRIAAPADFAYPPGSDATLWLTLVNGRAEIERLLAVDSPVAAAGLIMWDADCDGTANAVPSLPLAAAGPDVAPSPGRSAAPPLDDYHIRLIDLATEVLAGTNIPVTFTFDHAGTVTLEVPVRPSTEPRTLPTRRCPPTSPPPGAVSPTGMTPTGVTTPGGRSS